MLYTKGMMQRYIPPIPVVGTNFNWTTTKSSQTYMFTSYQDGTQATLSVNGTTYSCSSATTATQINRSDSGSVQIIMSDEVGTFNGYNNDLYGSLGLRFPPNCTSFNVSNNNLTGSLPPNYGALHTLELTNNSFSGNIPRFDGAINIIEASNSGRYTSFGAGSILQPHRANFASCTLNNTTMHAMMDAVLGGSTIIYLNGNEIPNPTLVDKLYDHELANGTVSAAVYSQITATDGTHNAVKFSGSGAKAYIGNAWRYTDTSQTLDYTGSLIPFLFGDKVSLIQYRESSASGTWDMPIYPSEILSLDFQGVPDNFTFKFPASFGNKLEAFYMSYGGGIYSNAGWNFPNTIKEFSQWGCKIVNTNTTTVPIFPLEMTTISMSGDHWDTWQQGASKDTYLAYIPFYEASVDKILKDHVDRVGAVSLLWLCPYSSLRNRYNQVLPSPPSITTGMNYAKTLKLDKGIATLRLMGYFQYQGSGATAILEGNSTFVLVNGTHSTVTSTTEITLGEVTNSTSYVIGSVLFDSSIKRLRVVGNHNLTNSKWQLSYYPPSLHSLELVWLGGTHSCYLPTQNSLNNLQIETENLTCYGELADYIPTSTLETLFIINKGAYINQTNMHTIRTLPLNLSNLWLCNFPIKNFNGGAGEITFFGGTELTVPSMDNIARDARASGLAHRYIVLDNHSNFGAFPYRVGANAQLGYQGMYDLKVCRDRATSAVISIPHQIEIRDDGAGSGATHPHTETLFQHMSSNFDWTYFNQPTTTGNNTHTWTNATSGSSAWVNFNVSVTDDGRHYCKMEILGDLKYVRIMPTGYMRQVVRFGILPPTIQRLYFKDYANGTDEQSTTGLWVDSAKALNVYGTDSMDFRHMPILEALWLPHRTGANSNEDLTYTLKLPPSIKWVLGEGLTGVDGNGVAWTEEIFKGVVPDFSANLDYCRLFRNKFTICSDFSQIVNTATIELQYNMLYSWNSPTISGASWKLFNNSFNTNEIDKIIKSAVDGEDNNGYLDIGVNSAPSQVGLDNVTVLRDRGWTVYHA